MTSEAFAQRFPEFAAAGAPLIESGLAAAAAELCAEILGDAYDEIHGLLAASKLANSPLGHGLRMKAPPGEKPGDVYRQLMRDALARSVEGMFIV